MPDPTVTLRVLPGGTLKAIWPADETFDLRGLGGIARRASHVEMIDSGPHRGRWHVDFSPLGLGYEYCLVQTFDRRADALAAEHQHLLENWL